MKLIYLSIVLFIFSMQSAVSQERGFQLWQNVGANQDSTSTVIIKKDGSVVFHSRFSNGHRTDGDHFVAEIIGRTKSGEAIFVATQGAGVTASYGGKTRVANVYQNFQLSSQQMADISYMEARHYQKDTKGEWGFFIAYKCEGDKCKWDFKGIQDPVKNTRPGPFIRMKSYIPPVPGKPVGTFPKGCPECYDDAGKLVGIPR